MLTNEIDIAWAAGLFEGEGSLSLTPVKNRPNSIKVSASLSMTDKDVVEKFQSVVNFGKVKGPYQPQVKTYKVRWVWEVQNQPEVLKLIELFLPFFGERRLAKAFDIQKEIRGRVYATLGFPKGFDGNRANVVHT